MGESDTYLMILDPGQEKAVREMILVWGEDRFGPPDESVNAAEGGEPVQTLNVDEVQAHLREIVSGMRAGEEVLLTDNGQPLAKLVKTARTSWPCRAGSAKGKILHVAPDFDAPLEEFKEYME
jgi:antitoxin (DNA-binding transcriptional repressor) of toxin-antitoxin stability system